MTAPLPSPGHGWQTTPVPQVTVKPKAGLLPNGQIDWYHLGALANAKILLVGSSTTTDAGINVRTGQQITPVNQYSTISKSALDAFKQFAAMSQTDPTGFSQLQQQLFYGGYYGSTAQKNVQWGRWSDESAAAVAKALRSYVSITATTGAPLTFNEYLNNQANLGAQQAQQNAKSAAAANAPQKPVIQLSDPNALADSFTSAFQQAAGMAPSQEQINNFVSSYHAQETSAQEQSQNPGATVVTPNADSAALAAARSDAPQQVKQYATNNYKEALANLLGVSNGTSTTGLPS